MKERPDSAFKMFFADLDDEELSELIEMAMIERMERAHYRSHEEENAA